MDLTNVNWLAIIVAGALNMVVGFAWYSRPVFGNTWMNALGRKMEDLGSPGPAYALTIVGSLLIAYVMAVVLNFAGVETFTDGVLVGFLVWLGFVLPTMGANAIFEGKGAKLIAINTGYPLVAFLLMGGLLGAWS